MIGQLRELSSHFRNSVRHWTQAKLAAKLIWIYTVSRFDDGSWNRATAMTLIPESLVANALGQRKELTVEWPNVFSGLDSIARLSHGDDMTRRSRIPLKLTAQLRDVRIDGAADDRCGVSPNLPH